MEKRICRTCKEEKLLKDFSKNPHYENGYKYDCKKCEVFNKNSGWAGGNYNHFPDNLGWEVTKRIKLEYEAGLWPKKRIN